MTDLILKGGRIIDPASGPGETVDISFDRGKVCPGSVLFFAPAVPRQSTRGAPRGGD
jgi:predicted amidohydrolase